MAKIDFGGTKENVVTRAEFPLKKAQQVLKNEVVAIIGYGVQGPAQSLNMRDNGINVIIGQDPRFKGDWDRAAGYYATALLEDPLSPLSNQAYAAMKRLRETESYKTADQLD